MLLVGFEDLGQLNLSKKYPDKINVINESIYNKQNKDWIIKYIEDIKTSMSLFDVTYIDYNYEVVSCLQVLNLEFKFIYTGKSDNIKLNNVYRDTSNAFLLDNHSLEWYLSQHFTWVNINESIIQEKFVNSEQNVEQQESVVEDKTQKSVELENIKESEVNEDNNLKEQEIVLSENSENTNKLTEIPQDKNKLTMEQLLQDDVEITEADVRDLKATSNKLKVGMLLQAKTSLRRVLKLSNTLDKLYDELLDRVDTSLETTDTASLMYTTEYIAKALNDTNQFIVSLINNEKIQNFFIVDNSSIVNIGSIDNVDIDKREKIRKATEIVMDNIDYFVNGEYENMKNPNSEDIKEEDINANQST